MIALDLIEVRFPWRGFWQDWGVAALCIAIYLFLAAILSGTLLSPIQLTLILPQLAVSVMIFPIVAKIASLLDRVRLTRVRRVA